VWIHSWNHTYARVVTHELGMSCLAKNNLSLSGQGWGQGWVGGRGMGSGIVRGWGKG
jgi:hypothetical protein